MLLEQALQAEGFSKSDAEAMNTIIEAQKKDFVVRDSAHAMRLVLSYREAQDSLIPVN